MTNSIPGLIRGGFSGLLAVGAGWATQSLAETNMNLQEPATVLAHSLFARFTSRQDDSYAMKVAAALRNQFGGHAVKSE